MDLWKNQNEMDVGSKVEVGRSQWYDELRDYDIDIVGMLKHNDVPIHCQFSTSSYLSQSDGTPLDEAYRHI